MNEVHFAMFSLNVIDSLSLQLATAMLIVSVAIHRPAQWLSYYVLWSIHASDCARMSAHVCVYHGDECMSIV